ncbi:four helix bundle protein [Arcicella rosea]|uniref:Four helix bundle protein n=1 Tax=Arcicella rosea TaxID=502909 RepID=A0A841EUY1_9BACT|nr:four helix bundle protein [Arcicella rosea]MBB6004873.1 four helix bundle protein [Arcicella rosea]
MRGDNFRELNVWKQAVAFVTEMYVITKIFPQEEQYGLTSQIRRASVSIPSNIAEGSGRSDKDFTRFVDMSLSSAYEVETQLIIAKNLGYISEDNFQILIENLRSIENQLHGLSKYLNRTK